jgi:hypothetical protein
VRDATASQSRPATAPSTTVGASPTTTSARDRLDVTECDDGDDARAVVHGDVTPHVQAQPALEWIDVDAVELRIVQERLFFVRHQNSSS